ncbi:acyltransferase family protein [Bradyrhizobium liaoningense]|uniref:acyltransferase family protein n=1 Tax=Bradyrhizobium liaoningense TaxID=43992 RepID=UPI001BAA9A44|nr:acyltransferase [Bradyrhizobium liaoningense]MBR0705357.1 acyltransferase [Bradyrhizobium liaoningense]
MHRRLAFIDTLRGIAVLSVVVQHALEVIVREHPTGAYHSIFHDAIGYYMNFGRFGVALFFFVSGFVIPFSFPASPSPVNDFAVSRFFRLYPAYWASIAIGLVTMQAVELRTYPLSQIVANVTMFQSVLEVRHLWDFYWTLTIELMFYVVCIILFTAGLLTRRLTAVAIVVATALAGTAVAVLVEERAAWVMMEIGLNLSAMFLGKIIRDTVVGGTLRWRHVAVCTALYAVFAITLAGRRYGGAYEDNFFYSYSIGAAYVSAAVVFIVFAAFGERMAWRPLAFVGLISYSVYLMSPFAMVWIHHYAWPGDGPLAWLVFVAEVVTSSIFVSWMTYSLVEKPWISFARRLRSDRSTPLALEPALGRQGAAQ